MNGTNQPIDSPREYQYKTLLVQVSENGVATIIINRQEERNSLNHQTIADMQFAFSALQNDDHVSLVILTGSGEKSFAAGADIAQVRERTLIDGLSARMQKLCLEIEMFEKPTIAAINGYALGGGCELALACDIRIAARHAKFGFPELNLGIIPGAGGTQRLSRLVGKGRAIEMILTGAIIDAEAASQIGLVSQVTLPENLLSAAAKTAELIVSKGPIAVRLAKLVIRSGFETDLTNGLLMEKLAQTILFTTKDKWEGTTAFLEKRNPEFQGI